MFRKSALVVLVTFLALTFSLGSQSQDTVVARLFPAEASLEAGADLPAFTPEPLMTIHKDVQEIQLVFTVADKHGRMVGGLRAQDFALLDDNAPVRDITLFNRHEGLPLRLGILIDASDSVARQFEQQRAAAQEFLRRLLRPRDEAFVMGFADRVWPVQEFTAEAEQLESAVSSMQGNAGLTQLYDAIYRACADRLNQSAPAGVERRALVLLTDGEDTASLHSMWDAAEIAQRSGVVIYSVTMHIRGREFRGDRILRHLANATGGRAYIVSKVDQLDKAFEQINAELRSQYSVTYRPPQLTADGRFHRVQIVAPAYPELKVRTRTGYFAPASRDGD